MSVVILDTGPLVAALDASDQYHAAAVSILKEITLPLHTCESVITEACFLLSRHRKALEWLGRWIGKKQILIPFQLEESSTAVFGLIEKYRDQPMSLADACLVAMVEANPESRVFTFDHHFQIYRMKSRRKIRTLGLE